MKLTQMIIGLPYNPRHWLCTGRCLDKMGYPGLAAGDFYKTILLCDAAIDNYTTPNSLGESVLLELGMTLWVEQPTKWEGLSDELFKHRLVIACIQSRT